VTDLVIIGLGYVGLPLAHEATRSGLDVKGFDLSQRVVEGLNSGRSHVDDLSDADVADMLGTGFRASADESILDNARTVVICVPTPLGEGDAPDLGAVVGAATTIARHLSKGTLVVLESTTWPGTTEEVIRPILEEGSGLIAGTDFHVAFSPERIDPGNETYGLRNTPKVVGGLTQACTDVAASFYSRVCDTVVRASGLKEAETAKLLENTYRHINIALVNEMAQFCHALDIDLWDVIRCASTKPFGFQAFYPGPGVGGHCIPIDPNYLSYRVRVQLGHPFRFVELAQEINAGMPAYIVSRAQDSLNDVGKALRGSTVLLLGVTYKPDIADQRESPSRPIAQLLQAKGAHVIFHDPHVDSWTLDSGDLQGVEDLTDALKTADLSILLQSHRAYDLGHIVSSARRLLDTRGKIIESPTAERL
jgi:UDP-N-acetyl-D-glucosamine dehydrogenase